MMTREGEAVVAAAVELAESCYIMTGICSVSVQPLFAATIIRALATTSSLSS